MNQAPKGAKSFQEVSRPRLAVLSVVCVAIAIGLGARAAFLQILPNKRLEQVSRRQFQSRVLIKPRRGPILDRNGEALAVNIESNSLAANPGKIKNKAAVAQQLARATDIPYGTLIKRLSGGKEFVWIKRHITEAELGRFRRFHLVDEGGDWLNGLWLVKESKRGFPHGELASQVLGSVNIDAEGLEGVELWMNERMRGKIISVEAIKDALGRPAFLDAEAAKKMNTYGDGEAVQLTVDASLQFVVEQQLRIAVQKSGARGGMVIVMNAVTGELLAIANSPSFDPHDKSASQERRRNKIFTDGYEPGSTLKAVLAASALSHGWKLTDQIHGGGGLMEVQGHKISEAEAHEKFEWLSLSKVLQVSSNVGAAKVAIKLGADHYLNTLKSFGFGVRTGSGFPGEISGRVPPRKAWQPLTLANIGFGQGILVTPIQMARTYATFINGGWLVQPTIFKSSTSVGKEWKTEPPRRILTESVARDVLKALRTVAQPGGTGEKANLPGYTIAGKTGTAQVVDPVTGKYSQSRYISSFIGFPVGLPQKFVIYAAIDGPQGVYYASENAAPLFREVLNAVANRYSLPQTVDTQKTLLVGAGSPTKSLKDRVTTLMAHPEPAFVSGATPAMELIGAEAGGTKIYRMPELRGLTAREALRSLKGKRFELELSGSGLVKSQSPEAGKTLAEGTRIRLHLAE